MNIETESTQSREHSSRRNPKEEPNQYHVCSRQISIHGYYRQNTIILKARELLEDKQMYIPVNKNPIQKLDNLMQRTLNDADNPRKIKSQKKDTSR